MRVVAKESEIQNGILAFLAIKNVFAGRINTGTAKIGKRFFRAHSFGAGCADILAFPIVRCPNGDCGVRTSRQLWIEVKRAGAKPSPEQYSFGSHVTDLGHYYLVARSIDDVALWLDGHS
jgi:hypothetical protein